MWLQELLDLYAGCENSEQVVQAQVTPRADVCLHTDHVDDIAVIWRGFFIVYRTHIWRG